MASIEPGALLDFASTLKTDGRKTGGSKLATVVRVDGEQAYVKIPGGVEETPVATSGSVLSVGDTVSVSVQNGKLRAAANVTNPSAGILKVQGVEKTANDAVYIAESAEGSAAVAYNAATSAVESAATAYSAAQQAISDASDAATAASNAQTSADNAATAASNAQTSATTAYNAAVAAQASATNANEYASRALGNLSTVQSVAETLTWITQHGTMALTADTTPDPSHVYFVRDNNGDYTVGSYHYSIVAEPVQANMGSYYELSIDESLNNYVGTHLALTGDGLWLLPATSGTFKVLVATGAGSTYTTAGTYIIDGTGGIVGKFAADEIQIGDVLSGNYVTIDSDSFNILHTTTEIAHFGYGSGNSESGSSGYSPYYTLGTRKSTSTAYSTSSPYAVGDHVIRNNKEYVCKTAIPSGESWNAAHWVLAIGNYSFAEGYDTTTSGYTAHAEGWQTTAIGSSSHSEGYNTLASGNGAHVEGYGNVVSSGLGSHAEGSASTSNKITASGDGAHAEGTSQYGDIVASGVGSHAEGSHTQATKFAAHAEGANTTASGNSAHAEGNLTTASGDYSHVEGYNSTASGDYAHAEGFATTASGGYTHAGGYQTTAGYDYQTAIGKFNQNKSTNLFEIGYGSSAASPANVFEVDTSGNGSFAGALSSSSLTLAGHSTAIGSQLSTSISSAQTVSNNSTKALGSISLPTGTWLLMAHVQFSNNTTGYREISLSTTSGSIGETYDHMSFAKSQAPSGGNAVLNCHDVVVNSSSSNATYYLNAWQNSGSSLTATGKILATRLV